MQEYLDLRDRLMRLRETPTENAERDEDQILDVMDAVWARMTSDEIARIEQIAKPGTGAGA
jgi:hypothetical protein